MWDSVPSTESLAGAERDSDRTQQSGVSPLDDRITNRHDLVDRRPFTHHPELAVNADRRFEVPFVRNAWMAGMWPHIVVLVIAAIIEYGIKFATFDEVPGIYWWSLFPILLLAQVIRMVWRRNIRSPKLTFDGEVIRTSFTESDIKQITADRVTEVQIDERRSLIRFLIPDGLSLAVRADLLELGDDRPVDLAHRFAAVLEKPLVPVRRWLWRWNREDVSTTPV
jgi:hypothetical protein